MTGRARRILWLIGLLAMLAHATILIVGAMSMWQSRGLLEPHWRMIPPMTRAALWVHQAGWWFLALNALLDVPVVVAHVRAARGRRYKWLIAGTIIARLLLAAIGVAATAYLVSLGRIQTEVGRFGATWRVYEFSDVVNQLAVHLYLSLPLLIFAMRWWPLLWPAHRRRLAWARGGCCHACGYDLRATNDHRCPECGAIRPADQTLTANGR